MNFIFGRPSLAVHHVRLCLGCGAVERGVIRQPTDTGSKQVQGEGEMISSAGENVACVAEGLTRQGALCCRRALPYQGERVMYGCVAALDASASEGSFLRHSLL
jgi:hypothetical protein